MHPEAASNIKSTLDFPPWAQSLHRDVYMTIQGEKRVPFPTYVQPDSTSTRTTGRGLKRFNFYGLPKELQCQILEFCPADTLFQLMRVSSALRIEAGKLFWENKNAYYLVEADWLLEGAYPGSTHWNMAFLPNVESLEVSFPPLSINTMHRYPCEALIVRQDYVHAFWEKIILRFPQVKRVILNHSAERRHWENHIQPPSIPFALQVLLQACPRNIRASALVLERQPLTSTTSRTDAATLAWHRLVYRYITDSGLWQRSKPDLSYTTVLMPARCFNGPVGEYKRMFYIHDQKIQLKRQGLWPLMVEALAQYYFNPRQERPGSCLLPNCSKCFGEPGYWMAHVAESHVQTPEGMLMEIMPTSLRVDFEERIRYIEGEIENLKREYRRLQAAWNTEDPEKRGELERKWMDQLENDEAWYVGEQIEGDEIWPDLSLCV